MALKMIRKHNRAWPETALLAKCEDGACQGAIAEKKRNFN